MNGRELRYLLTGYSAKPKAYQDIVDMTVASSAGDEIYRIPELDEICKERGYELDGILLVERLNQLIYSIKIDRYTVAEFERLNVEMYAKFNKEDLKTVIEQAIDSRMASLAKSKSECSSAAGLLKHLDAIDSPLLGVYMRQVYFDIPEDERFELFMGIFVRRDYLTTQVTSDIWEDVLENVPEDDYIRAQQALDVNLKRPSGEMLKNGHKIAYKGSNENVDNDSENDLVTLYRGTGSLSAPLDESHSWTTDKEVAERFTIDVESARVYMATINKKDIKYFTNLRNESEAFVNYEDLLRVKKL